MEAMKDEYMVSGDGRKPRLIAPPKACETHSHIIGPADKYPRIPGRKPNFGGSIEPYETLLKRLGMERCVIVQPSIYGRDNRCTLDAIAYFGQSRSRGVAVTTKDVSREELLALLGSHRNEPDAALLASCRASLEDVLDRGEERGWLRRTFSLLPSSWLAPRPAWSAAILLLIGFSVGVFGPRLLRRPANIDASDVAGPSSSATTVAPFSPAGSDSSANPAVTPFDFHTADVAGISVFPSGDEGPARVQLQLKAQRPVTVEGTVNDDNVKGVLLGVLRSGERSCPDVRLDAVECLRGRSNDPDVRSVLCQVVHTDRNAAVRLKALEALNSAEPQKMVRETLLDALVDDQNPGVRIEAVNALRDMAAKGQADSDDRMFSVLHDRMQKDPNIYIRLQSAAAIRDLGPREKF